MYALGFCLAINVLLALGFFFLFFAFIKLLLSGLTLGLYFHFSLYGLLETYFGVGVGGACFKVISFFFLCFWVLDCFLKEGLRWCFSSLPSFLSLSLSF